MSASPVRGMAVFLLLLALLSIGTGCHWGERAGPAVPTPAPVPDERAGDNTFPPGDPWGLRPAVAVDGPQADS